MQYNSKRLRYHWLSPNTDEFIYRINGTHIPAEHLPHCKTFYVIMFVNDATIRHTV